LDWLDKLYDRLVDFVLAQKHQTMKALSVISGVQRGVDEMCALLGYYAASRGNSLPTFRDILSVSSSRVNKSEKKK
jgi:hypothetical protein